MRALLSIGLLVLLAGVNLFFNFTVPTALKLGLLPVFGVGVVIAVMLLRRPS